MRRGDLYRYEPVIARVGQSSTRLIVSADALNANDALPTVSAMHVVDSDPGSLLAGQLLAERGTVAICSGGSPDRPADSNKLGGSGRS